MMMPTVRTYLVIFVALLALLAISVVVAYRDLGPFNLPVALAIAGLKAVLVVLYFMHVRYAPPLTWLAASGGLVWLGILLGLSLADYQTRGWPEGRQTIEAQ